MRVEYEELASIVARGAKELGIDLPSGAAFAFNSYFDLIEKRGMDINLTAISGEENTARLHFLDSLALLKIYEFKDARVIDVGSGAGFPGVPLKLAEPSIDLTLLDATGKRIAFLSELCSVLGISASCVHARAEEAAHRQDMREQFDIALSRAVGRLNILCELCLPFVCVGGMFIAMKGVDSSEEIADAREGITALGAQLQNSVDYAIPEAGITHRAVLIRKTANTPDKHPRRFARIQKHPL